MKLYLIYLLSLCLFTISLAYVVNKVDPADDQLLDQIERAAFLYFWEQTSSQTGIIKDRGFVNGNPDYRPVSSIAATGFGLTALAIAHNRSYYDRAQIEARVQMTLNFIMNKLDGYRGFYYHFVDTNTGKRIWNSELSSIDTALLINGVLTVRQYFSYNLNITTCAKIIYERVDYKWMLNGANFLSMGWKPESGFLSARWSAYNELMELVLQGSKITI